MAAVLGEHVVSDVALVGSEPWPIVVVVDPADHDTVDLDDGYRSRVRIAGSQEAARDIVPARDDHTGIAGSHLADGHHTVGDRQSHRGSLPAKRPTTTTNG